MQTFAEAGGRDAALLIHDATDGDAIIDISARFGRGLPAHVIPFAVTQVTQIGLISSQQPRLRRWARAATRPSAQAE